MEDETGKRLVANDDGIGKTFEELVTNRGAEMVVFPGMIADVVVPEITRDLVVPGMTRDVVVPGTIRDVVVPGTTRDVVVISAGMLEDVIARKELVEITGGGPLLVVVDRSSISPPGRAYRTHRSAGSM